MALLAEDVGKSKRNRVGQIDYDRVATFESVEFARHLGRKVGVVVGNEGANQLLLRFPMAHAHQIGFFAVVRQMEWLPQVLLTFPLTASKAHSRHTLEAEEILGEQPVLSGSILAESAVVHNKVEIRMIVLVHFGRDIVLFQLAEEPSIWRMLGADSGPGASLQLVFVVNLQNDAVSVPLRQVHDTGHIIKGLRDLLLGRSSRLAEVGQDKENEEIDHQRRRHR